MSTQQQYLAQLVSTIDLLFLKLWLGLKSDVNKRKKRLIVGIVIV